MDVVSVISSESVAGTPPVRPESPFPLVFPQELLESAAAHLCQRGDDACEQMVLFAGVPANGTALITTLLLPDTKSSWGHVEVVRSEQPAIAEWLVEHRQLLFVESHTHGGRGARSTKISSIDTATPVSIRDGFLTVIVPAYAQDGIDFRTAGVWECHRLKWRRLSIRDVASRFSAVSTEEVIGRVAR
jgi:hypothetical protein